MTGTKYRFNQMIRRLFLVFIVSCISFGIYATTYNIAPAAHISASSEQVGKSARAITDGVIGIENKGEWTSDAVEMFWGETDFPWVKLEWDAPVTVNEVVLYDRAGASSHTAAVSLCFSDGSRIDVGSIPDNGTGRRIEFEPRATSFIKIDVIDSYGNFPGLSEVEVYQSPGATSDFVGLVNPYVETVRGRYFFFATGSLPMGMISSAPMTRNKNQGGGGYNYNDRHILGFPQIHAWMLSGLTIMPVSGEVDYIRGENVWKSAFSHDSEVVRPGYHRVFLDDYNVWVEQTVTDRTGFYRLTYTRDSVAAVILNLGGYVGTSTMVNAKVKRIGKRRIEGSFDTVGRLWGGPDSVSVFFVAEFDRDMVSMDAWDGDVSVRDAGDDFVSTGVSTARNEGMSYHDAPTAGVAPRFIVAEGEPLLMKISISYVSVENAADNLAVENSAWDFDNIHAAATAEWNSWLGRIVVEGGSVNQRVKFYTDLWHTLLGRHKIDDVNGQFPDRTDAMIDGRRTFTDGFKVGEVRKDSDGAPVHHMYNSDALWLTQWNQNTLWGLAYPDLLDDFCASLLEYAGRGKLLPRGPCGGGYSFIMSGCPATSMITSAFQRGICSKWDVASAYEILKRNHDSGGMMGYNYEQEFEFYRLHGYAPEKGGLTVQWAFEDWALAEMAESLGYTDDADAFRLRAGGWRECIHPELHLLLPKCSDGRWLHTDPLNGWGFEEANSWQTTFGLSHDLPGLCDAMGGKDVLCRMLNYAMEQSVSEDFTGGYGTGYVSYANQPGLSTAHVFSHAGKPWLTQYWVRRVNEQAYGSVSPFRGYGGHDEDQGQMSGVSALMSIGLFSVNGGSARNPAYEITSPVFDRVTINLHPGYYSGEKFEIVTHDNSEENCYINRAVFNGKQHDSFLLGNESVRSGGTLELWLSAQPNFGWGIE